MSWSPKIVTRSVAQREELPDRFGRGVATLLRLQSAGVLEGVAERVRYARQGGYSGFHLFVLAVLHLCAGPKGGMQAFCRSLGTWSELLAAVVGQQCLPAASSSSRLLEVPAEVSRRASTWLLTEALDLSGLFRSEAMAMRDTYGRALHVFDFDPTVEALHRRSVAQPLDAPPVARRTEGFATPGYTGRKRGELRIRRSAMQHAGSGAWVYSVMDDGKGDLRETFGAALDVAARLARGADAGMGVLIRMDAEFSGVPYLHACAERSLHFVTRLPRHTLLERPSIQKALRAAQWFPVENCGGPQKYAAELGWCLLEPADETVQADGTPYPAQRVRIVVTRMARDGAAGRGVKVGDEQVEMFATNLDEGAMPAPAVCECYQRRSALENRFAQEDREFGLGRIFCYDIPGQELMTAIGLMLWNLQITEALAAQPIPAEANVPQTPLCLVPTLLVPLFSTPEEGVPLSGDPEVSPDGAPEVTSVVEAVGPAEPALSLTERTEALEVCCDRADWSSLATGWTRLRGELALQCPMGKRLSLSYVDIRATPRGAHRSSEQRLVYRSRARTCVECPFWSSCHRRPDDTPQKAVNRTIPPDVARLAAEQLHALRESTPRPPLTPPTTTPRRPSARWRPQPWCIERQHVAVGPYAVQHPRFLPREARRAYLAGVDRARFKVELRQADSLPSVRLHPFVQPPGTSAMPARQTWTQRQQRYALRAGVEVSIEIRLPPARTEAA